MREVQGIGAEAGPHGMYRAEGGENPGGENPGGEISGRKIDRNGT